MLHCSCALVHSQRCVKSVSDVAMLLALWTTKYYIRSRLKAQEPIAISQA